MTGYRRAQTMQALPHPRQPDTGPTSDPGRRRREPKRGKGSSRPQVRLWQIRSDTLVRYLSLYRSHEGSCGAICRLFR